MLVRDPALGAAVLAPSTARPALADLSYPGGLLLGMGQSPLFDPPAGRLGRRLHDEVFGALPSLTARALDDAQVAAAVRPLLERGWRPAQLAARVGALPAAEDPVAAVTAFLEQLLARDCPQQEWERERAARADAAATHQSGPPPASAEVRAHWVAEARRALGVPAHAPRRRPEPARPAPVCSSCGGEGAFFVTREVRLCADCVALLSSGRAHLAVSA